VAVVLAAVSARAERADYVGSATCLGCHRGLAARWATDPHNRAGVAMQGAVRGAAGRCAMCHATGDAPAGRAYFAGVQCEACHGPGGGYAEDDLMRDPVLARLLGLRDLSTPAARAALCQECHTEPLRLLPFEPERAWQQIAH
jgi:hypothetical protein